MRKIIVTIFGYGNLGSAVAERLSNLGFAIDLIAVGRKTKMINPKIYMVDIKSFNSCVKAENIRSDYIIVCTPGDVLEKCIDDILLAKRGLIILSTDYDEEYIKNKCKESNVSCVMSQNMALPILEMWNIFEKVQKITFDEKIYLDKVIESHPGFKKDISGTLLKTLSIFESLGIEYDFDILEAVNSYEKYCNGSVKKLSWIRNPETQINKYTFLDSDYIDSHAYHTYFIKGDYSIDAKCYLEYLYSNLKRLEKYSNDTMQFIVNLSEENNILSITHNINGRSIYGDGVAASIEFLQKNRGVFTGIDVIKSITK